MLSGKTGKKLVVFDVEGVVLPKGRYLLLTASKHLGLRGTILLIILGFLYEIGIIPLEVALRRIYRLFNGVDVDELHNTFKKIPMIPGSSEVFQKLREKGYQTALMTSGLPTIFVEVLAKRLEAEYVYGLEFEIKNGRLTGELKGNMIKKNGKFIVVSELLNQEGFSKDDCIIVADDRNNLPIVSLCRRSIGYNPDFLLSRKVDVAIKGDLSEIVPYIESDDVKVKFSQLSKNELFRKSIHMGSYAIPVLSKFLEIDTLITTAIVAVSILYVASELFRLGEKRTPIFSEITKKAIVGEEAWNFAFSPLFFAIGIALTLLLFKKPIGYVGVTVLTLGDGSSTLFGKKFGRTFIPFNKSKTLEGTLVGYLLAFFGSLVFTNPLRSLVAATIGALVEALPLPINDNISVPILSSFAISLITV